MTSKDRGRAGRSSSDIEGRPGRNSGVEDDSLRSMEGQLERIRNPPSQRPASFERTRPSSSDRERRAAHEARREDPYDETCLQRYWDREAKMQEEINDMSREHQEEQARIEGRWREAERSDENQDQAERFTYQRRERDYSPAGPRSRRARRDPQQTRFLSISAARNGYAVDEDETLDSKGPRRSRSRSSVERDYSN